MRKWRPDDNDEYFDLETFKLFLILQQQSALSYGHSLSQHSQLSNQVVPETYLEPCQISMMEFFCENSKYLKAINNFRKRGLSRWFGRVVKGTLWVP